MWNQVDDYLITYLHVLFYLFIYSRIIIYYILAKTIWSLPCGNFRKRRKTEEPLEENERGE